VANTKQKPAPEGTKRSPGKSKFSIPRKEAPPIDGSYLDRLFADYEKQTKELGGQTGAVDLHVPAAELPEAALPQPVTEYTGEEVGESSDSVIIASEAFEESQPVARVVSPPFPERERPSEKSEATAIRSKPAVPDALEVVQQSASVEPVRERDVPALTEASTDDALLLEQLKRKRRLGKGEVKVLRVMIGLCRTAGVDYCYIKVPQLMQESGLKERQTQLVLRNLRELGLIEKLAGYSNADRIGTRYRLTFYSS
jgi:hypothetical protein